jgi:hypothetical protein
MTVNESKPLMPEPSGCRSNDLKSTLLPKSHGGGVCAHHNIELNTGVSFRTRKFDRVLAQRFSNSLSALVGPDHISAVGNMTSQPGLIGFNYIRADNLLAFRGNERVDGFSKPILIERPFGRSGIKGIGIATLYYGGKDLPDLSAVTNTIRQTYEHMG